MKAVSSKTQASKVLSAAKEALNSLNSSLGTLNKATQLIDKIGGDIIITGIGKSGFVGQKIAATLTSLGRRASFLHPVEAIHGDLGALSPNDVIIALSFSGETKEVTKIASYAKKNFKVPIISFTKSRKSTLGKLSDVVVEVNIKDEGSHNNIAPMASTTATLVLGDMLAAMLVRKDFKPAHFARFHPGGSLGLALKRVGDYMTSGITVPKVKDNDQFINTLREISEKRLGFTSVVDSKNKLVGVITDGDTRRFLLKKKSIEGVLARDVMTKNPKTLSENATFLEALSLMEQYKITNIVVTNNNGKLSGVLHIHQVLEEMV